MAAKRACRQWGAAGVGRSGLGLNVVNIDASGDSPNAGDGFGVEGADGGPEGAEKTEWSPISRRILIVGGRRLRRLA
jgi:hypothetical protein